MTRRILIAATLAAAFLIAAAPASAAQFWAAGDIAEKAYSPTSPQQQTADIISDPTQNPTIVIPLGDAAYETAPGTNPTLNDYQTKYAPAWGQFSTITRPVPGNHDYLPPPTTGYRDYFGCPYACNPALYYSFTQSGWLVIVLDSDDAMNGGTTPSPQYQWLKDTLAANTQPCILAAFHRPRYTSATIGGYGPAAAVFTLLYNKGADVILNGHAHVYERTGRIDSSGAITTGTTKGLREFVVGTGGAALQTFGATQPWDVGGYRDATHYGVLKFIPGAGTYSWKFFGAPVGSAPLDTGSDVCNA